MARATPWIERGTQFVALVEDPARDGCHWVALLDGRVAEAISGGEWLRSRTAIQWHPSLAGSSTSSTN